MIKEIRTVDAAGHVLCHDLTQIIPGEFKGARFRKGHVVTEEDIPVLLSMGKEHLYVLELDADTLHEDDAAERLADLTQGENMRRGETKEGKIELFAETDGVFLVDSEKLYGINAIGTITIATRRGGFPVKKGDKLAGMRVIPLTVKKELLDEAEQIAKGGPVLSLLPYRLKTAAVLTTGNEVKSGRIEDRFTPVLEKKLAAYGIRIIRHVLTGDDPDIIVEEIHKALEEGTDLILCTGGMSVDPDDRTPGAIRASGADVITYGTPVLPGAMFLYGLFPDGTPVLGLPGCVMFAKATVLDLMLPRIAAGVPLRKEDFIRLGEGGLCLGCDPCTYPHCPFGR